MHELMIFTVFDDKATAYLKPFVMENEPMALRAFTDAVNDEGTEFWKHPEDYTLWRCGIFDCVTGEIAALQPYCMAKAFDVKKREE